MKFFKPKWHVVLPLMVLWLFSGFLLVLRLTSSGCLMLYDDSGNYLGNCGFDYTILSASALVLLTTYLMIAIITLVKNRK